MSVENITLGKGTMYVAHTGTTYNPYFMNCVYYTGVDIYQEEKEESIETVMSFDDLMGG